MQAEQLFLQQLEQMSVHLAGGKELDTLNLGGVLRQMICDEKPLLMFVNKNRIPIRFKVVASNEHGMPDFLKTAAFHFVTPYHHDMKVRIVDLDIQGFLAHPIIRLSGTPITVKALIRYAANVGGGVHYDPKPKPEYRPIQSIEGLITGNLPISLKAIRDISIVFLEAVEPLKLLLESDS